MNVRSVLVGRVTSALAKARIAAAYAVASIAALEEPHSYSSTQVDLPDVLADALRAIQVAIPDSALSGDGKEDRPHVTIKYGLHTSDESAVRPLLESFPPISLTLGETKIFTGNEDSDVLYIEVYSPDLVRMNHLLSAALAHTDTHDTYTPHATVAYLQPGQGQYYTGNLSAKGIAATVNEVLFISKEGNEYRVPLRGTRVLGGPGSGNFGHSGRPGEIGGSGSGEGDGEKKALTHTIKRGPDFQFDGTYHLKFSDEREYPIFRDTGSLRMWEVASMNSGAVSAFTKAELIDKLRELDESQPNVDRYSGQRHGTLKEALDKVRKNYGLKVLGGPGSGYFEHGGRPGEVGGSAPGMGPTEKVRNERSRRALEAFVPIHAQAQRYAESNELMVRQMIGGKRTDDNLPVDVEVKIDGIMHGVEVKTMVNNTNDKITMRKGALEKKEKWAAEHHDGVLHTVVLDDRGRLGNPGYSGHRLYYHRGTGSFRLGNMTPVRSAAHLRQLLREQTH